MPVERSRSVPLLLGALLVGAAGCPRREPVTPSPAVSASVAPKPDLGFRWVSGDVHLHTESNPSPGKLDQRLTPAQVMQAVDRADLDVGVVLAWGVRPERTAQWFTGPFADVGQAPRLLHVDLETSSFGAAYVDHVVALGLQSLEHPRHLHTLPIVDWAAGQKAVVGVAHASHWPADPATFPQRTTQVPAELPACLALGRRLFLITEVVDSPGFRALWYGLLDCGFRVPLAGGSDWPVAGDAPGETRTYVGIEGRMSYPAWIAGIHDGCTTVSSGPHDRLTLRAGEVRLGGELALAAPGEVEVTVGYRLERAGPVELVLNGAVAHTLDAPAGEGELTATLTLTGSSWLAARCPTAHTGAIYALVGGRPIRASAVAARTFRAQVAHLLDALRSPRFIHEPLRDQLPAWVDVEAERAKALAAYEPALAVFEAIAAEADAR